MQDVLKKYLPYFFLLLLVAVTILIWLFIFPTGTRLDSNNIFFESIYLIVSLISFYLIGFYFSLRKTQKEFQPSESFRHELDHASHHDSLTGLPNRILLTDRLQQAIASAKRKEELLAVHLIDLDNFRDINDNLGHHYGDQVLKESAYRLRTCVRDTDTIARWGGDEFAVIQTNINTTTDAETVAKKMIEVLSKKLEYGRETMQLTISIGIAFYPLDTINFDDLLIKADKAMYKAKEVKRSAFELFTVHTSI